MKKAYSIFMIVFLIFITLNMGIHVYRTKQFNQRDYVIDNSSEECTFSFKPQNDSEISWTRTATIDGERTDLNACSFEGKFVNNTEVKVSEWTMRLDVLEDCFLNSAWCGVMEIHQNVDGEEKVQTLDLRNFDKTQVELTFYEDGDIYLFPLTKGDYIIYYPDLKAKELNFAASEGDPAEVGIGVIFYWNQNSTFNSPLVTVNYKFNKGYLQGREAVIWMVTSSLWILFAAVGIAATVTERIIQKNTANELAKKDIERKTAEKMLDEMIKTLASSIDVKDGYTHGHSERVAKYSLKLAQNMSLSSKECKEIFYAGLVHDVGKIIVPSEIINKPGRLTDAEFDIIKLHPGNGEKILRQIEDMPYLAEGARYHHEKYDGTGYPSGAKGEEIPKIARIIAVADAYDAMTSHRSYRNTLDQSIVKQEIWKGIGTQFDPLVAKHMIALIDADIEYDMREKTDETYNMIDDIRTNEFWADYDPKSIKSEAKIMSDTDTKYFGEFVCTVDQWSNPKKLCEITEEETEVTFTSTTKPEAEYVWNAPIALIYSSKTGEPIANDYVEYAVFMSAGYSWKTGATIYEESTLIRKDAFDNWNNWLAKNKEGVRYTYKVRKAGNMVYIVLENDYLRVEGKVEMPNIDEKIYLSVSGEYCDITD